MISAKLKRLIDEMLRESQACSNCCYNVGRNSTYNLPDYVRESLVDSAAKHDVAVHLLREELKNH
jgi:hypothetical protein